MLGEVLEQTVFLCRRMRFVRRLRQDNAVYVRLKRTAEDFDADIRALFRDFWRG